MRYDVDRGGFRESHPRWEQVLSSVIGPLNDQMTCTPVLDVAGDQHRLTGKRMETVSDGNDRLGGEKPGTMCRP
jgi:hypothetical protein